MSVSGGSVTEATISGLIPSTAYSIEVAAVTGDNYVGVYSSPIIEETNGEYCCYAWFLCQSD